MNELANTSMPLVSVVTAMYNAAAFIDGCIDSVVSQTYSNWEMLIVDDGSTDESAAIVANRAIAEPRIKLFKLDKNAGMPYAARNFATDQAKGKYIAFLDSDDAWAADKLSTQVRFMEENKYAISFTAYEKIYESSPDKRKVIQVPSVVNYSGMLKTNHIGNLTAMYCVERTGKLYQSSQCYEDYIMWLGVMKRGVNAYGINRVLACYRVRQGSQSADKVKMAKVQWNIYRNIVNMDFFRSFWYLMNYCYNGLKKL